MPQKTTMKLPDPMPTTPRCPRCGEGVRRIHRRLIDRVTFFMYPVRRYHCDNPACQWEGNLPRKGGGA